MFDLESYDDAVAKMAKLAVGNAMPLHSWDFHASNFDNLKASFSDAQKLQELAEENRWIGHWNFLRELQNDTTIVVTDSDLKIVFASENILGMTGYLTEEVVGNSPKMFQGEATLKQDLKEIRTLIDSQKPFEKSIVNYKKNGEMYHCQIAAFPVFNAKKQLVHFVAFEKAA